MSNEKRRQIPDMYSLPKISYKHKAQIRGSQTVGPPEGAVGPLGGDFLCEGHIYCKGIWGQDKIYILVGNLLG
jgi:hypothetical protein